jgi:hypothetical protein
MQIQRIASLIFKGRAHLAPGRPLFNKALFVLAVLAAGFAPEGLRAQTVACYAEILNGTYAFSITGTVVGVGPAAVVGQVYFDGRGNGQIADTQSSNGTILSPMGTLTFTLNTNCTGTETITNASGITLHLYFVLSPDGSSLILIRTDAGFVLQGQATRIARWVNLMSGSAAS